MMGLVRPHALRLCPLLWGCPGPCCSAPWAGTAGPAPAALPGGKAQRQSQRRSRRARKAAKGASRIHKSGSEGNQLMWERFEWPSYDLGPVPSRMQDTNPATIPTWLFQSLPPALSDATPPSAGSVIHLLPSTLPTASAITQEQGGERGAFPTNGCAEFPGTRNPDVGFLQLQLNCAHGCVLFAASLPLIGAVSTELTFYRRDEARVLEHPKAHRAMASWNGLG